MLEIVSIIIFVILIGVMFTTTRGMLENESMGSRYLLFVFNMLLIAIVYLLYFA